MHGCHPSSLAAASDQGDELAERLVDLPSRRKEQWPTQCKPTCRTTEWLPFATVWPCSTRVHSTIGVVLKTIGSDGLGFITHPTRVTPQAPDPSVAQCLRLHPKRDRHRQLTVSRLGWEALHWWKQASLLSEGASIGVIHNCQLVMTDAPNSVGGLVWAGGGVRGPWSDRWT